MNRKLKFRIWSNLMKRWLCEDSQYLQMDGKKVHAAPWSTMEWDIPSEQYVIQQFTGLKDCKGVEIYEGDRIEFYSKDRKVYYYGEIRFTEGAFLVKIVGNEGTLQWFWMYHLNDYEQIRVVGNIFELPCNPDHNGECLVCDCWLSDCEFIKKYP